MTMLGLRCTVWMAYASNTSMKKGEKCGTSPTTRNGKKTTTSLQLRGSEKGHPGAEDGARGYEPSCLPHGGPDEHRRHKVEDVAATVLTTAACHGGSLENDSKKGVEKIVGEKASWQGDPRHPLPRRYIPNDRGRDRAPQLREKANFK